MPMKTKPPSILELLDALAGSNNHNRDLKFVCSGITLSYHQSILFMYSPLLSRLLGSLSCCRCNTAQCGRKEEVVVVLDNVEVNTVQRLMEYLYRGECKVKDMKGFQEMRELVNMLGLTLKLEMPRGKIDYVNEVDISVDVVNKLKCEQKLNVKFNDLLSQGEFEQECSKCGEALNIDTFKKHYSDHIRDVQNDVPYNGISINKSGDLKNYCVSSVEVESLQNETRLSRQAILCMVKLDNGTNETSCNECGDLIAKNDFIEHLKSHSIDKISKLSTNKNKRGPKAKTARREISLVKHNSIDSTVGSVNVHGFQPSLTDIKVEPIDEAGDPLETDNDASESNLAKDPDVSDEYTCFNPTFKIKPGVRKARSSKKSKVKMPVPEIKLTFRLDGLGSGITQSTIKLNDLSSTSKSGSNRKIGANVLAKIPTQTPSNLEIREQNTLETKKRNLKAPPGPNKIPIEESLPLPKSSICSKSEDFNLFSLPSSSEITSFPSFLREVCERVEYILPSGQNLEEDQQNRRMVHKMAAEKVCSGGESLLRKEDILREIGTGIDEDDEKSETVNNISSDGSEMALVMDLPDQ